MGRAPARLDRVAARPRPRRRGGRARPRAQARGRLRAVRDPRLDQVRASDLGGHRRRGGDRTRRRGRGPRLDRRLLRPHRGTARIDVPQPRTRAFGAHPVERRRGRPAALARRARLDRRRDRRRRRPRRRRRRRQGARDRREAGPRDAAVRGPGREADPSTGGVERGGPRRPRRPTGRRGILQGGGRGDRRRDGHDGARRRLDRPREGARRPQARPPRTRRSREGPRAGDGRDLDHHRGRQGDAHRRAHAAGLRRRRGADLRRQGFGGARPRRPRGPGRAAARRDGAGTAAAAPWSRRATSP